MGKQGVIEAVVSEVFEETAQVKRFRLISSTDLPLPRFSGGAHITTYIEESSGALLERHYSLTSHPKEVDYYEIAIQRNPLSKGGSVFWHDHVRKGTRLEISLPKNHFHLSFIAKHHVFFAAGIGITPFITMAADLKRQGRTFELHYAARSQKDCTFYDWLKKNYPNETHFYFTKEQSRMSPEIMKKLLIGTHVYFCGPETMVREFTDSARSYGYPEKSIHFELFSPPDFGPAHPFEVKLAKSNQLLQVGAEESLLEVLLKNGVDAPYSCKIGGCGSCELEVLEGTVDHRDVYLSDEEKNQKNVILTCVSRGKSDRLMLKL